MTGIAAALVIIANRDQLDASNLNPIARGELRGLDALAIDERSVRAVEVAHFEAAPCGGDQPAMNSRDESGVDAEVSAGCATESPDAARQNPKHLFGFIVTNGFQDPHTCQ